MTGWLIYVVEEANQCSGIYKRTQVETKYYLTKLNCLAKICALKALQHCSKSEGILILKSTIQKMRFQSQQQQNWIENRCLFGKMVPKHLLQLIFLSVICIFSFKILELRFRYELYDSNEILGKESQEQSKAWFWAEMGHLGSTVSF